jgi:hypothetical protein
VTPERHITHLITHLEHTDLDRLKLRLIAAARRNDTATTGPDGYPAGGTSNGPPTGISDPTGTAATNPRQRDDVDHLVRRALSSLTTAVQALHTVEACITSVENLADDADLNPPPGCEIMARIGVWEPVHRRTTFNGDDYDLGRWVYDFARLAGRLPTRDECRLHAQGRRVRITA